MNRPLRILVGTRDICGTLLDYADGLRQLGHHVTTVVVERALFYETTEFDVDLTANAPSVMRWPGLIARARFPLIRVPRGAVNRIARFSRILSLLLHHDVFIFQYGGSSLFGRNREYSLLKKMGKRLVSIFNGNDVRHISTYRQQYPRFAAATEQPLEEVLRGKGDGPVERPLRNLRMAERFSDLIVSVPNQAGLAVRPYMHFLVPLVLANYKCHIPNREVPLVLHAPSRKAFKGTPVIKAALDRLRNDGVPFELRLLDGVPNCELLPLLSDADVVIDQLNVALHGKLGLEAMASGCALATCNIEEYEPFPPNRPIWHIDANCIYAQLKRLLTDRELRVRLAREGRAYVERYHDHVRFARQIMDSLQTNRIAEYTHYPTFFAREYRLEEGERIPAYLKRMTAQIVRRWGLPQDVDPRDLVARGLMSGERLEMRQPIPRWPDRTTCATTPTASYHRPETISEAEACQRSAV